jgi:hypothetical protein
MTLATFLDAAYALQLREAVRLGIPLLDALQRLESMGRRTIRYAEDGAAKVAAGGSVEAMNEASLRKLKAMMAGG